jgi:hypothetical protein
MLNNPFGNMPNNPLDNQDGFDIMDPMKTRYLFLDCEMGGIGLQYSLLTAAFYVTNRFFEPIAELDLMVKPDDGDYILTAKGMGVNKIDIVAHDKAATTYKQSKPALYDFLSHQGREIRLVPVGHGVKGDIAHIIKNLISVGSWETFCTYHYIDTSVVLQFLRSCGKMPDDIEGSVTGLAKYFHINQKAGDDAQYHNAMFDAKITAKIYQKMVELGSK